jgi:hypothetical protein
MPNYVVERYRSRSDPDSLRAMADRLAAGARSEASHGHIRYVHTIFVPEDETCLHLFEADSEAEVRAVARQAGIDIDRIVPAEQIGPSEAGWRLRVPHQEEGS